MGRYVVDAPASTVTIEARTTLHPVVVRTSQMTGHLDVEVAGDGAVTIPQGASWQLEVRGDSLKSGNLLFDREAARRIDWRAHPVLRGVLVEEVLDARVAAGEVRILGDVTFHGSTRQVSGTITVTPAGDGRLAVRGQAVFDVQQFGLKPPKMLMMRVEPEVTVSIDLRAVAV